MYTVYVYTYIFTVLCFFLFPPARSLENRNIPAEKMRALRTGMTCFVLFMFSKKGHLAGANFCSLRPEMPLLDYEVDEGSTARNEIK